MRLAAFAQPALVEPLLPRSFMLRYLSIQHLAVIENLSIDFDAGLNVLTGETGAGKSILVEAVGLLLGARASSELVRTGEDVATIQAIFDGDDGDEIVVRREITAQGRSRAFVDGALATAATLRDLASRLIELHGQHDHQGLLLAERHLDMLDSWAGLDAARARVAEGHQALVAARAELETLRLDERQTLARIDLLTLQRDEISRAAPVAGEVDSLTAERQVLANAERLLALSADAYQTLYERDGAILSELSAVWRRVEDLAAIDPSAAAYTDARTAIQSQLEDLAFYLRDYASSIDASPGRLQHVEDRLAVLERLMRKYGPTLDDVLAHLAGCERDLAALTSADERIEALEHELAEAERRYLADATALSRARREAAAPFATALVGVLAGLAMEKTRFEVRFDDAAASPARWGPRGVDVAEFYVSPNPGEDLRPLARIVSGGELSRIMLAIRTLTARKGKGTTLIFDEVDAGIGGHAADVVGRRLQALGEGDQVLCITHLPQIAAYGDVHYVITKEVRRGRTVTAVSRVDADSRAAELARMIAGQTPGAAVLTSAAEMLAARRRDLPGSEQIPKGESERAKVKGKGKT